METFNSSAIALQKVLLNLRQQRDQFRATGHHQDAEDLAPIIACIEAALASLKGEFKPTTLQ
ncbi:MULTISPECIES: hypothetical protein [Pseudomonas]|uniref:Uncharacterized protein n=1 Tax=Pseudomonas hunanensis TaxID=1247546 RepID=A0ACC6KA58_9PSED|nr:MULTISPECIES: hypothetical protein [Pseudomonas]MBP2263161.1 hypothetical protein [Pseudomonas sp. BP8]MDR6715287.1 hypothetical protein [Pseudomonas hunanensis]HDS1736280.1 hypothetical protein [Pseudomonas putida]